MGNKIATGAPTGAYALGTDPGMASLQALIAQQLAFAESEALAAQKRTLINYGDPALATALLGNDPTVSQAAGQNPFSTLANLAYGSQQAREQLDGALNQANLWYSSTRADRYGQLGRETLGQGYQAGLGVQDALTGINQGLVGARFQAQLAQAQEAQSAQDRQTQYALQYGTDPGAGYQPMQFDFGSVMAGMPSGPAQGSPSAGGNAWQGQWGGQRFGPNQVGKFKKFLAARGSSYNRVSGRHPGIANYFGTG